MGDYATTELSDALIKLGVKHGGYLPGIQQYSPMAGVRISGPAYTVQMVPFNDTTAPKPTQHFVDAAPEGHIIVISAPPGEPFASLTLTQASECVFSTSQEVKSAVWGGLMTLGAQSRGALGVVVAGRCRDISEHREAGFPVFAGGQSTLGQRLFTRPSALNVPLQISSGDASGWPDVGVNPGDWIVADQDGVVSIPKELLTRVCEIAEKGRREDEKCREDIIAGKGVQASFDKWRGKL